MTTAGFARNPRLDGPRVGIILPSLNTTTEPEFAWAAPPTLSFHATRVMFTLTTPEGLAQMNAEVGRAADLLGTATPDLVAYACTSGSFIGGPAGARALEETIAARGRCPVVTTSRARVDALGAVGASRIALATPYLEEVTRAERDFLVHCGFQIESTACLGLPGPTVRRTPAERIVRLVEEADCDTAEAVFVSCTDLRAWEVAAPLERKLGKPVLTSNQVTLWAVLQHLGLAPAAGDFGTLFARA